MEQTPVGSKKKGATGLLVAVAVVAIAVVVYFGVTGLTPKNEDAAGTIGAAERYRTQQMAEGDVILKDPEVQALLQNDKVIALLNDENFQKLAGDDNFIEMMKSTTFRAVASSDGFASMMSRKNLCVSSCFEEVAKFAETHFAELAKISANDQALVDKTMELAKMHGSSNLIQLVQNNVAVCKLLATPEAKAVFTSLPLQKFMSNENSVATMAKMMGGVGSFSEVMKMSAFEKLSQSDEFARILKRELPVNDMK